MKISRHRPRWAAAVVSKRRPSQGALRRPRHAGGEVNRNEVAATVLHRVLRRLNSHLSEVRRAPHSPRGHCGAQADYEIACSPTRCASRATEPVEHFPTATGPRKPVVNPPNAYSASAAPRCAGSAAATAPPASAPTSAKLVICTSIKSGRTTQIEPPAVADSAKHVATETRQMPITTDRRPLRAAISAMTMLVGTPANDAMPETTPSGGSGMLLPGSRNTQARYATNQTRTAKTSQGHCQVASSGRVMGKIFANLIDIGGWQAVGCNRGSSHMTKLCRLPGKATYIGRYPNINRDCSRSRAVCSAAARVSSRGRDALTQTRLWE